MTTTTNDVRVWAMQTYDGVRGKTYNIRWKVDGRIFSKTYQSRPVAVRLRAELNKAVRRGVPFDIYSGLPVTEVRQQVIETTWYDHAVAFMDMKWPTLQPGSRRSLAAALATVTAAMTSRQQRLPDRELRIKALLNWSFNRTVREAGAPSPEFAEAVAWVRAHSLKVGALNDARTLRDVYTATLVAPDGKPYAVNTHRNKMKALTGAIRYAIELDLLERNPLERLSTPRPRRTTVVDRRVVVNPDQARELIAAVAEIGWTGPRYVALFAAMYFAGLRPAEVLALRIQDCVLPDKGWGELCFAESTPYAGAAWTDDGTSGPRKALKHRAAKESRTVPAHPELVAHLRRHVEQFGTAEDGRFFVRANGGDIRYGSFASIWSRARKATLTDAQFNSPLGKRPYDLRHACVSTWLNAGVSAPQIAEWAGHSVQMLLSTYAKCIDGQHERDLRRIGDALRWQPAEPEHTLCLSRASDKARHRNRLNTIRAR
ncbi:tyrosine-type recombinase/integrase [Catenulispora rubra]|uniref:tyrosine-type recombinase/integrase n=1 Tax=Catenulispora rubra TaxID=280293 RepID=UPI0018925A72|nr:tyrosine-type recombinase/integrase [Catenulispora rubra]